ncbi:phosphatase domain-containing protein [Parasulfitobacter algicola]|uniref:phosphatase domain-containing protein n=1 Tax=Parasulfitobacter algicola TaxID=2614809 RepID=UPI001FE2B18F|nr:phosphatase domain-containing protein [Sulfitobacter algicola]
MNILKRTAHRIALLWEKIFDRLFNRTGKDRLIEAYMGYATDEYLIVRGRVLTALRRNKPQPHQSRLTNIKQILSLFLTDEVADVAVSAGTHKAQSDEEGYFQILVPRGDQYGWIDIDVTIEDRDGTTACPVLIPDPRANIMIISDIDDTMLETGAYSLARNLWTSFSGNALTRHVFPDAIELIDALSDKGRNPVYYVSSSPWNLFSFLTDIFTRTNLTRGPMFLRDLGLSETKFITEGHGNHKGGSIDVLLNSNAELPAILIGDTGQKDAAIYKDVIDQHPDRIKAVVLRTPGAGLDAADHADIAALSKTGIPVFHGRDFKGMTEKLYKIAFE